VHGYCHVRPSRVPPKKLRAALKAAELCSRTELCAQAHPAELFADRNNAVRIYSSAPISLGVQHATSLRAEEQQQLKLTRDLKLTIEASLPAVLPATGGSSSAKFCYYMAVHVRLLGRESCEPPLLLELPCSPCSLECVAEEWDPLAPLDRKAQFPGWCWDHAQHPSISALLSPAVYDTPEVDLRVAGAVCTAPLSDGPYNVVGAGDEQVCVVWLRGTTVRPGQLFTGMLDFANRDCTCELAAMSLHFIETVHAAYSASGTEQQVEQLCAESAECTEYIEQVGFILPVPLLAALSSSNGVVSVQWLLRIVFSVKTRADHGSVETMTWEVPLTVVQDACASRHERHSSIDVSI